MKLFTYYRSSAAFRVRIAINLKGVDVEHATIHLRRGEQRAPAYASLNPQQLVPALLVGPNILTQSLAIIDYLEDLRPEPPLLPQDPIDRAYVRGLALAMACDVHPVNNTRVLDHLAKACGADEAARIDWSRHWIAEGFAAIEATLTKRGADQYCFGDAPSLADVCLIPQAYNAERAGIDLQTYPVIQRIYQTCMALPAFAEAGPERQPDADA